MPTDREEAGKMEEWREQARKELDDWYRHRDEQFQKAKALNRYLLDLVTSFLAPFQVCSDIDRLYRTMTLMRDF